ncbi:MAG: hypothetical protein GXY25_01510, partial [Pirellulaceae bacterium]|nr:hypothetical protein [Pirellulaceae bacterium]
TGLVSTGLVSTGLVSTGLVSTGLVSAGLVSTGLVSTGLVSTGLVSTGLVSTGVSALGVGSPVAAVGVSPDWAAACSVSCFSLLRSISPTISCTAGSDSSSSLTSPRCLIWRRRASISTRRSICCSCVRPWLARSRFMFPFRSLTMISRAPAWLFASICNSFSNACCKVSRTSSPTLSSSFNCWMARRIVARFVSMIRRNCCSPTMSILAISSSDFCRASCSRLCRNGGIPAITCWLACSAQAGALVLTSFSSLLRSSGIC